ncbi:4964_t:CDS:2, partial [Funneliformis geosporum]
PNADDDDLYEDPLLIIEWNAAGLSHRSNLNTANTLNSLVSLIRSRKGCAPFPPIEVGTPSDSVFSFVKTRFFCKPKLTNSVSHLVTSASNWWRHSDGNQDVARMYVVKCPKKGEFDIDEYTMVFN